MVLSRWSQKSYSSRAKLGWLALVMVVTLIVCSYFNHSSPRPRRPSSPQRSNVAETNTRRGISLEIGVGSSVAGSSAITEQSVSDKLAAAQTPSEETNSWTTASSQDERIVSKTESTDLAEDDRADQALEPQKTSRIPADTAVEIEVTRSYGEEDRDKVANGDAEFEMRESDLPTEWESDLATEGTVSDLEDGIFGYEDNIDSQVQYSVERGVEEIEKYEEIEENQSFEESSEREPLDLEGNNEFNYEEDVAINGTETNCDDLEAEDKRNSSYTGLVYSLPKYNISWSEYGIVFADIGSDSIGEEGDDGDEDNNDKHGMAVLYDQPEAWRESGEKYDVEADSMSATPTELPPTRPSPTGPTTSSKSAELLFSSLRRLANSSNPHCAIKTRFRSWEKGIVTQLGIPIKRDCQKLRFNTGAEVKKVKLKTQVAKWRSAKPWEHFAQKFQKMSCAEIRAEFENNFYVSEIEKEFPISYIFVVYTNAGQILRLLKAVYRPHNLYCIHPDARQGQGFTSFFQTVAKCLDNVFVVSKPVRVYYGHISITDAQLHCMQDLIKYPPARWRYVINLCGREVPLRTNREIVEALVKMKGYTALQLRNLAPVFWNDRFRFKFRLGRNGRMQRTRKRQSRPPGGMKLHKSMNFMAASREFVSFLLDDTLSLQLRRYLGTVYAPEEHFYSSLYALPQAKGARPPRGALQKDTMPIVDMFIWVNTHWQRRNMRYYCPGRRIVHGICILTAPDIGRIEKLGLHSKEPVFFFNKYFLEWDPTPIDCMEERLVRTNMDEYRRDCIPRQPH